MVSSKRLVLVGALLTVFGVLILTRLFFLQIVSGDYYRVLADRQQISSQIISGRRGEIKMQSRGAEPIAAASTKTGYLLYVNPSKLEEATSTFNGLNRALGGYGRAVSADDFFNFVQKKNDPFEILLKRIEKPAADEIIMAGFPGIGVISEEWRFYPFAEFAAQVLGFVGYDEENREVGRYGLESFYELGLKYCDLTDSFYQT